MKTIPQVRGELKVIADQLKDAVYPISANKIGRKIELLIESLWRRPMVRRSKREHAKFTPVLANRIRRYAETHPNASYAKIGEVYNVAIGRVSESIIGKRQA